ncbi:response regulator [Sphingomonas sp. RB1R13]|uniref:response regulator n=1 Tax=Sphingomonas sp. RB1R13 TaxID=3096159 RepID=UPI002FCC8B70
MEDEPLIAMVVEDSIEMLGYEVIGPVAQHDEALAVAAAGGFDCAILDVNICGGNSYDVADLLLSRGCPFILATGYSDWSIPRHLVGEKRLTKPYSSKQLEEQLRLMHDRVVALKASR